MTFEADCRLLQKTLAPGCTGVMGLAAIGVQTRKARETEATKATISSPSSLRSRVPMDQLTQKWTDEWGLVTEGGRLCR